MDHKKRIGTVKQLNIELPKDVIDSIKIEAIKRNISMKLWILRVIIRALNDK